MNEINTLLEQWGAWSRAGVGAPSLKSASFLVNSQISDGVVRDSGYWVSESVLSYIDSAIALLGRLKPKQRDILKMYFAQNDRCYSRIARALKLSSQKEARALLAAAVAWVDAYLGESDAA